MKKSSVLTLTCFCFCWAHAQKALGLKDCIAYGLQNHKSNEICQGNIEKAKQVTRENVALYLPQITGDLRFDDYLDLQTYIIPAGTTFAGEQPSLHDREIQFGKKFNTTATVEAEQALYNRLLLVSFRALKPNMEVARLGFQQNRETLIYNISQAYFQVYILKQQLALLSENEKKIAKQLEITRLQVEKSIAKKIDMNRLAVAMNNIVSQIEVAESSYEVAVQKLKNAIGMELSDTLILSDTAEILLPAISPEAVYDMSSKTEILLQRNNLRLMEVQKKRLAAGYFPTLSFFARYSAQAYNDEFRSAFSTWYDFSSFGLKLSVPIFDGMQKSAQRKQQIISMRIAQLNLELNEQAHQLQYQNAKTQLRRAKSNLDNTEANVKLAKDVFDSIALMYQQGVAPLSEFLNAETAYKESRLNYITAMLSYYMAVIDFEKAKGTLETFYNNL